MADNSGVVGEDRPTEQSGGGVQPSITVDRELPGDAFGKSFIEVQKQHDKPVLSQVREMAGLAFSKGRVSPAEYFELRLFDDNLSWEQKLEFAGAKAAVRCWKTCNYDGGWRGLVWDKSAVYALLQGYGFPVPETLAIFHRSRRFRNVKTLQTEDDLCRFLLDSDSYPLFCKPNSSYQSLGSLAISDVDRQRMVVRAAEGHELDTAEFARVVSQYADNGYLVQKQLRPDPALQETIGNAVSTVRVLTINGSQGPKVYRTTWKIPGPGNFADNFWREGNMLAKLDPETGRVLRLMAGAGLNQREVDALPQSGTAASALSVPGWKDVLDLALAAADALPRLRLLGWDIAPTDRGPIIVEANDTPDFGLPQYTDQRGMLDAEFEAFMRECREQRKRDFVKARRTIKTEIQKDARRLRRQSSLRN